jgi:hypothetical protein
MLRWWTNRSSKAEEVLEIEFSSARYEPMARLMDHEDLRFLEAQPGFRPEIGRKFSRERRRIFRLYLRELSQDFHRLHAHARAIAANLPADHAPLVGVLIRQQVRFLFEMAAIELQLRLGAKSIQARALVNAIAAMHAEIGRVAAPAAT